MEPAIETAAEWPYTRWGMTAPEIVAASGGTARALTGAEQEDRSGPGFTTIAVDEIRLGPFEFEVSFRADAGASTLRVIRLELQDAGQFGELRDALVESYGPGEPLPPDPDGAIEGCRWTTPDDVVVLRRLTWPMDLGVDVALDYEAP